MVPPPPEVVVLRLGHRPARDPRLTTHVALTARAMGAGRMLLQGARDPALVDGLRRVARAWGGDFRVEHVSNWREEVRRWKEQGGTLVHLTMYGLNLPEVEEEIRKHPRVMVAVGSEKVPGDLYRLADWNVAVGHQPHSEVAALAIFLDRYRRGTQLARRWPGAKMQIGGRKRVRPTR